MTILESVLNLTKDNGAINRTVIQPFDNRGKIAVFDVVSAVIHFLFYQSEILKFSEINGILNADICYRIIHFSDSFYIFMHHLNLRAEGFIKLPSFQT